MLTIRAEAGADHAHVFAIQTAAFGRRNEGDLVEALRAGSAASLSLVAEDEGRILGHVFFSPVTIESPGSPDAAGLAPVAVDPAHQGRGIGAALVAAGLEACPRLGWQAVFLVGDARYYARFGFTLAAPLGFTYGDPALDAALQVRAFGADVLEGHGGRVRFHPAFVETGCG